jgi:predicted AAA+ superfamily ATPase
MRRFARRHALDFMDQQKPGPLNDKQVSDLAAEAKQWARGRPSRSRRMSK